MSRIRLKSYRQGTFFVSNLESRDRQSLCTSPQRLETKSLSLCPHLTLCRHNTYQAASTMHIYCFRSSPYWFFIPIPFSRLLLILSVSGNMSSPQRNPEAPAFTCLLDAYNRWQDFEQLSARNSPSLSNIPDRDEHAHVSVPTPASLAFMMTCKLSFQTHYSPSHHVLGTGDLIRLVKHIL